MCRKVHQKWVPAKDQGAFLTMFDHFFLYIKKNPNDVLPIFLCLEYYSEFLEKKITRSRNAPFINQVCKITYPEIASLN